MKIFITILTVLFVIIINDQCDAQSPTQTEVQVTTSSDFKEPVATPNSSTIIETVPESQMNQATSGTIKIIEGRKVFVDGQGVQSLADPASKPVHVPSPNIEPHHPE